MKLSIRLTKWLYQLSTINRKKYNQSYPADASVHIYRDVNYADHSDKKQTLDIYTQDLQQSKPVLVHIHGGGWTLGDKADNEGYARFIAAHGYVSVAINYTLAPKAPHPLQEKIVCSAFQWLSEHIHEYGGDPERIFISGDSGGAHLAAVIANLSTNQAARDVYQVEAPLRKEQIAGMVLFYGAYDFMTARDANFPFIKVSYESFLGTIDIEHHQELMKQASPKYYVTNDFPKSLLLSGEVDGLHENQTLGFVEALETHQVPYEKVFFDLERKDAVHGFMVDYSRECTKTSMEKVLNFMEETLGATDAS